MKVKQLEWGDAVEVSPEVVSGDKGGMAADSKKTVVGWFSVGSFDQNKTFVAFFMWEKISDQHSSLEEAKAACQADFERRVLSCLEEGE